LLEGDPIRARLVRRILRVDHAGEHGAVAIYEAQIARLGNRHPELRAWLSETLVHERKHRAAFHAAMPERHAKPCRALVVWRLGGRGLGTVTALLGRTGVMACTAAVERTVHAHLEEQIAYLAEHEPGLAALVREIQCEEDAHLAYAEDGLRARPAVARLLAAIVGLATEAMIALSTRGDSLRLRHALRHQAL
jgi:ubiquinone biosynthesis monooxygenase Coq7